MQQPHLEINQDKACSSSLLINLGLEERPSVALVPATESSELPGCRRSARPTWQKEKRDSGSQGQRAIAQMGYKPHAFSKPQS